MLNFAQSENETPSILKDEEKMPTADFALCFFRNNDQISGVTHHDIRDNKICVGEYVDQADVLKWLHELAAQEATNFVAKNEFIDEHILVNNSNTLVFYQKPFVDRMWIRTGTRHFALRIPYPALLYRVERISRRLNVYALANCTRPTLKTPVYHAPLMNIGSTGALCQGSAPIPDDLSGDCSQGVIDALFQSNFSHVNHSKTLHLDGIDNVTTDEYIKFFQTLEGKVDFPSKHLMPTGLSIDEILTRYA